MGYKPPMNWRTISQPSTGKSMGESHLVPITYSTKLLLKKAACMMFCGHFNLMWVHIRNMTIKKKCESSPTVRSLQITFSCFLFYLSLLASSCFSIFSHCFPRILVLWDVGVEHLFGLEFLSIRPPGRRRFREWFPISWDQPWRLGISHVRKLFKTSNTIHTWDMLGSS